jgi:hypothetical protein
MGALARTAGKTRFDAQLFVEQYGIHQHLLDGAVLVGRGKRYGTLLQSLVSLSSPRAME